MKLRITRNDGTKFIRDPACVISHNGKPLNCVWCTNTPKAVNPAWYLSNLNRWGILIKKVNEYNRERLKLLKIAKLKMLESKLQYQNKQGADEHTIHQTMKDIHHVKSEIQKLK